MKKRYDLCTTASKYGCGFFVLFIGGTVLVLPFLAPQSLAGLWILAPMAPIAILGLLDWIRSFGQVLEVDEEEAKLLKNGVELWRFRWADIKRLRTQGNLTWDFVDSSGRAYPLIIMNLPKTKQPELRGYLPDGVEVVSKNIELLPRGDKPSYPLAIAYLLPGVAALLWGGAGFFGVIRILRLGAEGEINPKLLLWQLGAIVVGVIATMAGSSELARRPQKPRILRQNGSSLSRYLQKREPLALPTGESLWTVLPGRENRRRQELLFLAFCLLFWGSLSIIVLNQFIRDHRTWPILAMYGLILGFHFVGVYFSAVKLAPKGVTIHIHGEDFWIETENQTHRAQFTKVLGSPALKVTVDGRRKLIDPEDFRMLL